MSELKLRTTTRAQPRKLSVIVRSYIATAGIRGDVAWVTSKLGMFMQQADESHMKIADRVIMYLAATCDYQSACF